MGKLYNYQGGFILDIGDGWIYAYNFISCKWERTWSRVNILRAATLIGVNYNETR